MYSSLLFPATNLGQSSIPEEFDRCCELASAGKFVGQDGQGRSLGPSWRLGRMAGIVRRLGVGFHGKLDGPCSPLAIDLTNERQRHGQTGRNTRGRYDLA